MHNIVSLNFYCKIYMKYSYKLFASIHDIDKGQWNSVCQKLEPNLFMDTRFIATVEKSMAEQSKFWHVIVYDTSGKAVACTNLCKFKVDLLIIAGGRIKKYGRVVRKIAPSFMFFDLLLCGLPVSVGQSQLSILPEADSEKIISLIDEILIRLSSKENSRFIVFKEFNVLEQNRMQGLLQLGYLEGDSLPLYEFNYQFSTFSEYLNMLKSHYRYDIKRSIKKIKKGGIEVVRLTNPEDIQAIYTRDVHKLYEDVVAHSENKLEILPMDFFHELAQQFSNDLSFTILYKEERIVAFNFALSAPYTYHFLFCGLDYSINNAYDLYFNLMYADLDNGLKHGVTSIKLGQTADTFKARLGSKIEPLLIYIKAVSLISKVILRLFFSLIFPTLKRIKPNNVLREDH